MCRVGFVWRASVLCVYTSAYLALRVRVRLCVDLSRDVFIERTASQHTHTHIRVYAITLSVPRCDNISGFEDKQNESTREGAAGLNIPLCAATGRIDDIHSNWSNPLCRLHMAAVVSHPKHTRMVLEINCILAA